MNRRSICPLALWLLTACPPADKDPVESTPPEDTAVEVCDVWTRGNAPWDPMGVSTCDGAVLEPLVVDGSGAAVALEPLEHRGATIGWVPASDLPAGDYAVVGFSGEDRGLDHPFTVAPYGRDSAFSAENVLGQVYQVRASSLWAPVPDGIGDLALGLLDDEEEIFVRVQPGDGEAVKLEVVMRMRESGAECLLLRDDATLSATGELEWSLGSLDLETDAGVVQAWDMALRAGWLADGSRAGGLEARATVDTQHISAWILESDDPLGACSFLTDAGLSATSCYRCAADGLATCLDLRAYAGTLMPVDDEIPDELPMCGLDLDEDLDGDLPSFSCDMPEISLDCGCDAPLTRGAALPLSLGLLAFLRGRRRRR